MQITVKTVIKTWRKTFQVFGFPKQIKTDNGPPFQSYKVREFMRDNNIKHRKITPLWPRANAICERFMRNLNRVMRNSKVIGSKWYNELDIFLSQYRATPHDSTGVAPAQLLLKTKSSTSGLPVLFESEKSNFNIEKLACQNDIRSKQNMKSYMDKKLKSKQHDLVIGDQVYVKSNPINKSTPRFDPEPYIITKIKGTMIEAQRRGQSIVRNC